MFLNINLDNTKAVYVQIYSGIKEMIQNGLLPSGSKLPSSRELAEMLKVSRTTVISSYEMLEYENFVYTEKGRGTFVSKIKLDSNSNWNINWNTIVNEYARNAENLDIMKHDVLYKKGMISFKSIAPDETLFDTDEFKRSFLNLLSLEGGRILNYGYARGYKPLIKMLMDYMEKKGASIENKSILITNGFTEGFDLILSSIMKSGDSIICENPTHNTAIKIMKLHGLKIIGINLDEQGIDLSCLSESVKSNKVKAAYLIPSYHNPTGTVMSYEKRKKVYEILKDSSIPIIEDGFTEELQHLGDHIAPIAAISGFGNSVIYTGSFSKILFPGMRIGWIFADTNLIEMLESVKRSRNIHTSFLDQGILYQYMISGNFEKYIKRIRGEYKERFELTRLLIERHIPNEYVLGDGGLYIFLKLRGINTRELLDKCCSKGVIFTPGDIFFTDGTGQDTLRIGFSRTKLEEIEKGIRIIGEEVNNLISKKRTCI